MKKAKIGVMDFHGSVDITDPCYDRAVWCRMNDVPIKEGVYTCMVWRHTFKDRYEDKVYTDTRVGLIGIYLDGEIPAQKEMQEIGSIGVDAGLAGFFHQKPDYDDEHWAQFCTRVSHGDVWLTENGFFSFSGFGDGGYDVYAKKKDGEIVALEIRFFPELKRRDGANRKKAVPVM